MPHRVAMAAHMQRTFHVYVVSNWSRCLYIGMTGDLVRRIGQHKGLVARDPGFTGRYHLERLVYFETTGTARAALIRERQLKGWLRAKKLALVSSANPEWRDLAWAWPSIEMPPAATRE